MIARAAPRGWQRRRQCALRLVADTELAGGVEHEPGGAEIESRCLARGVHNDPMDRGGMGPTWR
eukprot:COSAG01_NODE_860_length_13064_cov_23.466949_13_plen_64_part_00